MTKQPKPLLWLDGARGQYIPRDFTWSFLNLRASVSNVGDGEWQTLRRGPHASSYWDVWQDVIDHAVVTTSKGVRYTLHQDGDLWLIPEGMQWCPAAEFFVWPPVRDANHEEGKAIEEVEPRTAAGSLD